MTHLPCLAPCVRVRGLEPPAIFTDDTGRAGRLYAGVVLRRLQQGATLSMPLSRPMPAIGARCHELRLQDAGSIWRIIYRIDEDALVILDVFQKKTPKTPQRVIEACRQRLRDYEAG